MPVLLAGVDAAHPVATTSPLVELGCALHVLAASAHHEADAWTDRVRARLDPELRDDLDRWAWTARAIRAGPFVTPGAERRDFADELEAIRARSSATVAEDLLRPVAPDGDRHVAQRWARTREPDAAMQVELLCADPDEGVAAFVAFVERFWDAWFAGEWERTGAGLAARARRFADAVNRVGARTAVAALSPAMSAAGESSVRIAKVQNRRHDVAARGLVCVPSGYVHPHVYVADVPGRPLVLIHPADPSPVDVPTVAALMRRLETAAHPGRLEVARAIASEPRTAGEIAGLWGMDATLVNRHLRALSAAGLATPTRHGRYVRYLLDDGAVESLGHDLLTLLLR